MKHRDESGNVCTRHEPVGNERVLDLAILGSRTTGFHHDAASKLQSLVMALDEIGELAGDQAELRSAIDTAQGAVRELHALLNDNRGLAKPPQRTLVPLRDVLVRACERVGVRLHGELPSVEVRVAVPLMTHALELLLDMLGGSGRQGRAITASATVVDDRVRLVLAGAAGARTPERVSEVFTFAAYAIHRNHGELTCAGDDKVLVDLPRGG